MDEFVSGYLLTYRLSDSRSSFFGQTTQSRQDVLADFASHKSAGGNEREKRERGACDFWLLLLRPLTANSDRNASEQVECASKQAAYLLSMATVDRTGTGEQGEATPLLGAAASLASSATGGASASRIDNTTNADEFGDEWVHPESQANFLSKVTFR